MMCKWEAQQEKKFKIPVCLKLNIKVKKSGVRRQMKPELLKKFFMKRAIKLRFVMFLLFRGC